MSWYVGQISPANWGWLRDYFGGDPPWPMDAVPHIALARAIREGRDPGQTSFYEYLRASHAHPAERLRQSIETVRFWIEQPAVTITVEVDCVVDGNHRFAVASTDPAIHMEFEAREPYQTLRWPDQQATTGRRRPGRLGDIAAELAGLRVLELGCAQGAVSIEAAQAGARVLAVDARLTSTPWRLRDAWGLRQQITFEPVDLNGPWMPPDVDVVLAMSIRAHLRPGRLEELIAGRRCVLETHTAEETPPVTHDWRRVGDVPYSHAEPVRRRTLYWGVPR